MDFLHKKEFLNSGDVVNVQSSHQCNVLVMDDHHFSNYKNGKPFKHFGGFFRAFPANIPIQSSGNWNIVIDLGGGRTDIRYSINILKIG